MDYYYNNLHYTYLEQKILASMKTSYIGIPPNKILGSLEHSSNYDFKLNPILLQYTLVHTWLFQDQCQELRKNLQILKILHREKPRD